MYYFMARALKERIIRELRFYWSRHPRFVSDDEKLDLVNYIQGQYPFDERPQRSITVKTSGGNHVSLSADNFLGHLESHVMLVGVPGKPSTSIEWVRENQRLVQRGQFPSPPGIYFIEITASNDYELEFIVDPIFDFEDEMVVMSSPTEGQLQNSFVPDTLRLYEMPGNIEIRDGFEYTAVPSTGAITLTDPLGANKTLSADYRCAGERRGPFRVPAETGDVQAIPGAILGFGLRYATGDQMAVVVSRNRCLTDEVFGGKWDITLDIEVMGRDIDDQEILADDTSIYLQGVARSRLSSFGIEVGDISLGGETQEIYDDEQNTYYYSATMSATFQTDWEIHRPLAVQIRRVTEFGVETEKGIAGLSEEALAQISSNIQILEANNLTLLEDPFFVRREGTMEMLR